MFAIGNCQGILIVALIDEIGNQESSTPLLDGIREVFERLTEIRLFMIRLKVDQFADNIKDMPLPFLRRYKLFDLIRKENNSDFIVVLNRRKSQCSSNFRDNLFLHPTHCSEVLAAGHIDQ